MALVALVYLWPALVEGRVLSSNSVLFVFPPWRAVAPAGFEHTWNQVLTDIPTAIYPWNVFSRRMIHQGVFPAWNPYSYSGTPFFANAQTGLLNPLNVPLWLLPLNYGIAVSAWIKLWLGGFGTYLLVRELRLGFWPAVLAGVSFLLCAFNIVFLTLQTVPGAAVMMPWALLLSERIARRRRSADAVGLALLTAVVILAGHPETAVQVLAAALLYLVLRVLLIDRVVARERLRRMGVGAWGLVLGTMLAAVVLIPVLVAGLGTPGAAARTGGTFTLPWSAARTALFPNWWSYRPPQGPLGGNYSARTIYVGVVALLLAAAATMSRRDLRAKLPFVVLAAVGLAAAFRLPPVHWVVAHVPPLSHTTTAYLVLWFELSVAVLAAFGLEALMRAPDRQRRLWFVAAAGAMAALVAVLTSGASLHELRTTLNHFRTGRTYADPRITALTSVGWWMIFAALASLVLLFLRRFRRPRVAAAALAGIAVLDLLHFSHGYQPMLPTAQAMPPRTPAVAYLQAHAADGRVVGIDGALLNDYDMVYGLRDVRGYDPPQPGFRYLRLWRLANPTQTAQLSYAIRSLSPAGIRVLSLLGARYVIDGVDRPAPGPLPVVYRGADAVIYAIPSAAPRALVARHVLEMPTERATLDAIAAGRLDATADALVERHQAGAKGLPATSAGGSVAVTRDENARVSLRAQMAGPGLVVLNDAFADGWTVTVDGRPARPMRVDDVMRGVAVAGGNHLVTWRYRVPGLGLGLIVSAVAAAILLLWSAVTFRGRLGSRPRRRRLRERRARGAATSR